jgi:hypothetical protein
VDFAKRVLSASAESAARLAALPADQLTAAVLGALADQDPTAAVATLVEAEEFGLSMLGAGASERARALLAHNPTSVPGLPDSAWQVYRDEQRVERILLPAVRQKALHAALPIGLLDDFIDEEWLTAVPEPDGTARTAYLRARLAPEVLSEAEIDLLGWGLERERRDAVPGGEPGLDWSDTWRLLYRLQACDASAVHGEWSGLTRSARRFLDALRNVAQTKQVPQELAADRGLWPLLEQLSPAAHSPHRPFADWLAVRRLLSGVLQGHRAENLGDHERAAAWFQAAEDHAVRLRHSPQQVRWEAQNVRAYLTARTDSSAALTVLRADAESRPPRHGDLSEAAIEALALNRSYLEKHSASDRNRPPNPYLVLGVDDGSPDWKQAWRTIRRSLDEIGRARINQAKDRIEAAEHQRHDVPRLRLPLAPSRWALPPVMSPMLALPAEPVERWTEPPSDADRQWARQAAAREIVTSAARLGTHAAPEALESSSP